MPEETTTITTPTPAASQPEQAGLPSNTSEAPQFRATAPSGQAGPLSNTPEKPEFKAAVGMSRKWDAREAGREVARDTLEKLGKDPDFFLLFSTIHYEKHGGFQELLNGVWDILPKGTPLIGGTVAGFINPQGCWTRGTTALAVNYPNMDIATGIGHNTKRNPQKAAKECAQMIKERLKNTKYSTKFLYELVSGSSIVDIPGIRKRRVLTGKIFDYLGRILSYNLLPLFQKGTGREEEVLSELSSHLTDYHILGGSAIDYPDMLENYLFFNNKVHTNSIVSLGIALDTGVDLNTTYGLTNSKRRLTVTKLGADRKTLIEINGKPALEGYLSTIGMSKEYMDERLHRRTFFTPFGYTKNNVIFPNVIGLCFGNNIIVGYRVMDTNLELFLASGKSLIKSVDDNLDKFRNKQILFSLIVSCAARLETLGSHISTTRKKLLDFFGDKSFLLIYAGGEDVYTPPDDIRHMNESFNVACFYN
jgi:hypothetical protein